MVIAVNGSVSKPNAVTASKVPPTMLPPEISITPSLLISAYKPALVIAANKSPIVVAVPTLIVVCSLLEFLIITVWPFAIAVPVPISFNKVSEVAVVVCVTMVWCNNGFVFCDTEYISLCKCIASIIFVPPSLVIVASDKVKIPIVGSKVASIPFACNADTNSPIFVVLSTVTS